MSYYHLDDFPEKADIGKLQSMYAGIRPLDGENPPFYSRYTRWQCMKCGRNGCVIEEMRIAMRESCHIFTVGDPKRCLPREDPKRMKDILNTACSGFDINMCHSNATLLLEAVQCGLSRTVEFLLEQPGIDINHPTGDHDTVFGWALKSNGFQGHTDMVKLLLQYPGVEVGSFQFMNNPKIVDALLEYPEIDVNVRKYSSPTVLHYWISGDESYSGPKIPDVQKIRKLMGHPKIDVNKCDVNGRSPLFNFADSYFYPKKVDGMKFYLKDERVVLSVRDNFGKTVYDYIREASLLAIKSELFHSWKEVDVDDVDVSDQVPDFWFDTHAGEYQQDHDSWGCGGQRFDNRDLALLFHAEQLRLGWAKEKVQILRDWNPCADERFVPDDVLSKYVLPYVADILSPIETLGGGSLQ